MSVAVAVLECVVCGEPADASARRGRRGRPPARCAEHMTSFDVADPRHGTTNGFANLNCRCDRCRDAFRTYKLEQKARYKQEQEALGAPPASPKARPSADPQVREDGKCASCGKPRKPTKQRSRYAGDAALRDPFCSAKCCRAWYGCELAYERAPAPGRTKTWSDDETPVPAEEPIVYTDGCRGCGTEFSNYTTGCESCDERKRSRARRAKRGPRQRSLPAGASARTTGATTQYTTAGGTP